MREKTTNHAIKLQIYKKKIENWKCFRRKQPFFLDFFDLRNRGLCSGIVMGDRDRDFWLLRTIDSLDSVDSAFS